MYNSHKDSNFSLALNILDGCLQTQRIYQNKDKIGQDITPDNAMDMFRCAYQLASQMHKEAVAGLYFELAPSLYISKLASDPDGYFDPVRRLSLLPSFAAPKIKDGKWPLPFNKKYAREIRENFYSVSNEPWQMIPLSFTKEDQMWLCPEEDKRDTRMINVFKYLGEPVYGLLADAIEGQSRFEFPKNARTLDRWLKFQITETHKYYVPAVLYLLNFFPYSCSSYVITRPTVNVRFILDAMGADQVIGDSIEFMQLLFLPLLRYGPLAIRYWIGDLRERK